MIKRTKCYIIICAIVILLSGKTAQATPNHGETASEQEEQSTASQHEETDSLTTEEGKEKKLIHELEQAHTVYRLQQAEKNWNYKYFNWVSVFRFFEKYVTCLDFLKATQNKKLAITNLTKIILKKDDKNIKTEQEAQFFVYSALLNLHDYYVERDLQTTDNFYLLQQVASALPGRTLQKCVKYPSVKSDITYQKTILVNYKEHFMNNHEIRTLTLNNRSEDLISVIGGVTDNNMPPQLPDPDYKPTVEHLLAYYHESCHPAVFCHLLNRLTMSNKTDIYHQSRKLKVEKKLGSLIVNDFYSLWKIASSPEQQEHLAKMAIFLFHVNPLPDNSDSLEREACGTEGKD